MQTFLRDVRYAIRVLQKNRPVACVAVFTLAIGIATSTVGFRVFYSLLFNAFAARDANRLAVPMAQGVEPLRCSLSCIQRIRAQNHVFEDVVGYGRGIVLLNDRRTAHQFYGFTTLPLPQTRLIVMACQRPQKTDCRMHLHERRVCFAAAVGVALANRIQAEDKSVDYSQTSAATDEPPHLHRSTGTRCYWSC